MRERGRGRAEVEADLRAARARDATFASGRILGSMCTEPHPVAAEAYRIFLETNLGDPHLCPGTRDLEQRALAALGALFGAPPAARGVFVTGGSEANFTGLLACSRKRAGREVVLPESAHFSFDKAVHYLRLRANVARVGHDGRVDVDDVRERIGPDTCAVVALAGSTELGVVDPVPEMAAMCRDLGVPLHVDAAFGGFVVPFAKRLGLPFPDFDLRLPGVTTLCADPHKMGLAPIPTGVLFARDAADLDALSVPSPYVSVERQPTLQGTRPGAAPAATWAVLEHLGIEGYTRIVADCLRVRDHLVEGLTRLGFPPVMPPPLNVVAFRVDDPVESRKALREAGFLVSLAPMSRGLKVVVMPHVTRAAVDAFLDALPRCARPAEAA
ncbi:MAG TPA: tyrosine decarboxylase MfnA [Candidatus Thermoplasmatota archaeon]|nr:tyrosine decarboxylase MfnA [Candidatus Thermoplasmatota archaeon]